MTDHRLKPAPLAYRNEPFLNSPDGRILRLLSEYSEPLSRFRREQIQDTVVFFGSAPLHTHNTAAPPQPAARGPAALPPHTKKEGKRGGGGGLFAWPRY